MSKQEAPMDFWVGVVRGKTTDAIAAEMNRWRRRATWWLGPEWRFMPRYAARAQAASCRSIARKLRAARKLELLPEEEQ